jgi:hypothetical protein
MIFGDDALYYQIIRDAHDPDPAVTWRHVPFRRLPIRTTQQRAVAPVDAMTSANRLAANLRALVARVRPQPLGGSAVCCAPACC